MSSIWEMFGVYHYQSTKQWKGYQYQHGALDTTILNPLSKFFLANEVEVVNLAIPTFFMLKPIKSMTYDNPKQFNNKF